MKALLTLGAGLLLAGCASMAPPVERPAPPVAERFAVESPPGAVEAATLDWRRFYADARLQRLIELALANNRDLRIAALNIESARAQAQVRDADLWPTVNAGLAASRQPTTSGRIASTYTAGVQVTAYEADLFGRLRSLSDAAAAQVLAAEENRKAVQLSLVAAVASAHVALQADDELLRVTRETLATREDSRRLLKLRFDHGASSELDLRQADTLLEQARVALAQTTRQRALDENALVLLLGQPLPAELPPAGALQATLGPELAAGLPSEVLVRRPDVRQAEQQLAVATAGIGAARAAFFPRITLTGSAGSVSGELSGLFKAGSFAWSFAPQLLQPLFDAGRNQGNLKAAETARDVAVAQYERALQAAFREVADALAARGTLREQLQAQQRLLEAESARARLAELRWQAGATSTLEWLDARRSLFTAQQALVQVQAQAAQNAATLYKALGGGWSAEPRAEGTAMETTALIEVERLGGLAGYGPGSRFQARGTLPWEQLGSADRQRLQGWLDGREAVPAQRGADRFRYRITLRRDGGTTSIEVPEEAMPAALLNSVRDVPR